MEMRDGYKISQNDINLKLFQDLEKLSMKIDKSEERAEKFFEKADKRAENFQKEITEDMQLFRSDMKERMDKFESNITSRLNWSLGILTLVVVGVLVTGVWKLVSIDTKQSEVKVRILD